MKKFAFFSLASLLFALEGYALEEPVSITDSYARVSTPTAKVGAVFFKIFNNTDEDIVLLGAHSEVAAKTEVHTHSMNDEGVMSMIHLEEGVEIPASHCFTFQRGGHHIMLMGLENSLEEGQEISVTLEFEGHEDVVINTHVNSDFDESASDHSDDKEHEDLQCLSDHHSH